MRRAAKRDTNQNAITFALQQLGWEVEDLSRVGKGCPDLLVSRGNVLRLCEVKGAKGTLTKPQEQFHARFPVVILRDVDDVLALR